MVLATAIIAGILILLFGDFRSVVKGTYTIQVRFPEAPGVTKDTPVRRSGILIGRVKEVKFDENDNVIVTLEIDADRVIRESDEVRITGSLLGDAQIEVVRASDVIEGEQRRETAKPQLPADVTEPPREPPDEPVDQQSSRGRRSPFLLTVLQQPPVKLPAPKRDPQIRDAQPRVPAPAPPPRRRSDDPLPEGAIIEGRVAASPLETLTDLKDDFERTARSLEFAGDQVGRLATNLNTIFERNDQQIDRIINRTEQAMTSFDRAMTNINDVIGDAQVRADLKRSLADLPLLFEDTRAAVAGIEQAMRLVDSNLRNLEGFTGPLGERGPAIVGNIDSSIARLNELLGQLESFSRALNSPQGTLGQLINNPEIYTQINMAAKNINEITERIKPIVEDARIFSDKMARHPGVILRDAVKPGSGTKWVTPGH